MTEKLSQQPPSKNRDPVKLPLFENLVGGSPPPPSRKRGFKLMAMLMFIQKKKLDELVLSLIFKILTNCFIFASYHKFYKGQSLTRR